MVGIYDLGELKGEDLEGALDKLFPDRHTPDKPKKKKAKHKKPITYKPPPTFDCKIFDKRKIKRMIRNYAKAFGYEIEFIK